MTASRSRDELLHKRLLSFTRLLHGVEEGQVHAVHRTRVAARRLRELVPVLQLEHDVARRLSRRLRRVTRKLGAVRELDTLLLMVDELRVSGRYDEAALSRVVGAVAEQRTAMRDHTSSKLLGAELRRLAAKLRKTARKLDGNEHGRASTPGWQWAIDARVRHRADALREAVDAAGNVYLADRVHAVRIAVKKFRYAVELKAEVSPASGDKRLTSLKRTQRLLGRLHDRQVLIDQVRQVQASLTPPNLGLWRALDALLPALETECRRLHARYVRDAAGLLTICDQIAGRAPATAERQRAG